MKHWFVKAVGNLLISLCLFIINVIFSSSSGDQGCGDWTGNYPCDHSWRGTETEGLWRYCVSYQRVRRQLVWWQPSEALLKVYGWYFKQIYPWTKTHILGENFAHQHTLNYVFVPFFKLVGPFVVICFVFKSMCVSLLGDHILSSTSLLWVFFCQVIFVFSFCFVTLCICKTYNVYYY